MSNVPATLGTHISSTTNICYASCIGTYEIDVEYDVVSGNIRMMDVRKVFKHRLKESCLQCFKENIHLPFSKIPLHLQKVVIHDMETEFGTGWSVKKVKKQIIQNCKIFCYNLTKNIKQIPPKPKRRLIDLSVKVWKDLVKAYNRANGQRKSGQESTQVFKFVHKIISISLNDVYILLVHN